MSITTIIPTLNEELHVDRAVRSVLPLGPVFVVDSQSSDRTQEIAASAGAIVVEHRWEGYAQQKNWALDNLPVSTDWIFFLDADELVPPDLQSELLRATTADTDCWYVPRCNILLGRPLRHVWWYPDFQLRLFRRGMARYEERSVHEHMVALGQSDYIRVPLLHENVKGITAFLERHIKYAELEALEIRNSLHPKSRADTSVGVQGQRKMRVGVLRDRTARRRIIKQEVWYRTPCRPLVRFLWLYIVRRGFLDGRHGLVYAQLIAAYEAMIDSYLLELEHNSRTPQHNSAAIERTPC